MRTTTEPSEQEIKIFQEFCDSNNICKEDGSGVALATYMLQTWNVDVSDESLELALPKLLAAGQVKIYSPAQVEYDTLYGALSQSDQGAFGAWWFRQKGVLVLEGDEGYNNGAQIIAWMRGKTFDARTLDLAVSNLAGTSRTGLHWAPKREQTASGRPRHEDDGKGFNSGNGSDPRMRAGKLNHSYTGPADQKKEVSAQPADAWEGLCQAALNLGVPSQHRAMVETFNKARANGRSFRECYAELQLLRKNQERVTAR
jgi:hypothetical protein